MANAPAQSSPDTSIQAATSARPGGIEPGWTARWIQAPWSTERDGAEADDSRPMPVFRREFTLKNRPVSATLRIAGLGQYELHTNGAVVSAPGLHQAWTDYRKTVTYDTYDLTKSLRPGSNALGVMLGNGMYNVQKTTGRYIKFAGSFGVPKLIAELHVKYADGTGEVIASDAAWKVARGPVIFSSTYGGEDYDARRVEAGWDAPGFDAAAWATAGLADSPGGKMVAAIAPDVRVIKKWDGSKPVMLPSGAMVYDLTQNFAGLPHVRVQGPAGTVLKLTAGELKNADGSAAVLNRPVWWTYTLRGDAQGEEWAPSFMYYGFRYLQAEWVPAKPGDTAAKGTIVSVRGDEVSSVSQAAGSFESSDAMLNAIHTLIVNAMHNNEVSLFTDCPQREKLGWLEETHLVASGLMFNNDLRGLYAATAQNIADAQLTDGGVPEIAPQYTKFGPQYPIYDDSPEWGSAIVLAPWAAYRFYGDRAQLAKNYAAMQAYVKFLESKAATSGVDEGIVTYGLGDWGHPAPSAQPGVAGTLMLYENAAAMAKIATMLGHADDAARYATLAGRESAAFNRRFWNAEKNFYDNGTQTANAMPLALGIVPVARRAAVLQHIVDDIHAHNDHITTGEVGHPYLLRALMQAGRSDIVLAMLERKDPPSYGSQIAAGATSLTESWSGQARSSQDHFMLGAAEEWFYRAPGGIDFDMSRSVDERITIQPVLVEGVTWVKCSYKSVMGEIRSEWRQEGGATSIDVAIPPKATATLILPVKVATNDLTRKPAKTGDPRLTEVRRDDKVVVYRATAGLYHFREAEL
jgi:alpha-L-rhamnosidase